MDDVVASRVDRQTIVEAPSALRVTPQAPRTRGASAGTPSSRWRCQREHWHGSLDAADLDRLLAVLEADLIPCLLKGYSPAHHTPLVVPDS